MDIIEELLELIFTKVCFPNYKIKYKRIKSGLEGATCPICLDDYKKNDIIWQIECGHIYHKFCIIEWTDNNLNCPLCRETLSNQLLI